MYKLCLYTILVYNADLTANVEFSQPRWPRRPNSVRQRSMRPTESFVTKSVKKIILIFLRCCLASQACSVRASLPYRRWPSSFICMVRLLWPGRCPRFAFVGARVAALHWFVLPFRRGPHNSFIFPLYPPYLWGACPKKRSCWGRARVEVRPPQAFPRVQSPKLAVVH